MLGTSGMWHTLIVGIRPVSPLLISCAHYICSMLARFFLLKIVSVAFGCPSLSFLQNSIQLSGTLKNVYSIGTNTDDEKLGERVKRICALRTVTCWSLLKLIGSGLRIGKDQRERRKLCIAHFWSLLPHNGH